LKGDPIAVKNSESSRLSGCLHQEGKDPHRGQWNSLLIEKSAAMDTSIPSPKIKGTTAPLLASFRRRQQRFYPSELQRIWRNVNGYLVRWVRRKYKRLSWHKRRAWQYLRGHAQANPKLFVHWEIGCLP
jgi:hypothetical protein